MRIIFNSLNFFVHRNPRGVTFHLYAMSSSTSSTKIVAEYAKSGKSSCKKCSQKIDAKSLRLGLNSRDPRGFDSTKWHHLDCFFSLSSPSVSSAETIEGFSELTGSDQENLKQMVGEMNQSVTKLDKDEETKHEEGIDTTEKAEGDIETKSHRRSSKKQKTDGDEESSQVKKNTKTEKIIAEYAKSGRSSCKKCAEKIESKSLRLGLSSWDPRGFETTKWHHARCFFPLYAKLLSSVELIEGFSELKSSDQEMLQKLMSEGDQSSKKLNEDDENELPECDERSGKTSVSLNEGNRMAIDFAVSDIKDNYKDAKLHPKWKAFQTIIYLERDEGLKDSSKIAAFDFDGCLAKTSVQRVGADAWSLMYASIPEKLQSLYADGYKLVIFTNEANIERWKNKRQVAVDSKLGRLDSFIKLVKVPIQVFIACGASKKGEEEDPFRKPQPGMWRIMEQHFNSGIPVDMDKSFYVGDAAGRIDDHNDSDKKFAEAIGLKFYLPEEYFET